MRISLWFLLLLFSFPLFSSSEEFENLFDDKEDFHEVAVSRAPRLPLYDSSAVACNEVVCNVGHTPHPDPEPTPFCLERDFCVTGNLITHKKIIAGGMTIAGVDNVISGCTTVYGKLILDLSEGLEVHNHLYISGTISAESFLTHSDSKLKQDIVYLESFDCLEHILALHPCSYYWNEYARDRYKKSERPSVGFIAQEVQEVMPFAVHCERLTSEEEDVFQLDYQSMIPELVGALKACNEKISALERRIAELEKIIMPGA